MQGGKSGKEVREGRQWPMEKQGRERMKSNSGRNTGREEREGRDGRIGKKGIRKKGWR